MTGYQICAVGLMLGGLPAALLIAGTGRPADRLVGVQLVTAVVVVAMMVMGQIAGESYELIVPLVLVVLSVTGTLVFTRLIGRGDHGA